MDSKLISDSRLADLVLSSFHLAAKVEEIPGASIDSGNVKLDLSKFGEGAEIKQARFGSEIATLSESSGIATLDFTSAATSSDLIEISFQLSV